MHACTMTVALWLALAQGGGTAMSEGFVKAVTGGDVAAIRSMLAADPALCRARDERGVSALLLALYYRQADVARLLADGRDDLDVFEAAATGRADRVRALLAKDPSLANAYSPDGFPALGLAVFFGQADTAEALVAAGADTKAVARNPMRVAPIHAAAAAGRVDLARLLLDHGADPNARQEGDFAPLHEAARAGNLELVKLLVERGADVDATSKDGGTPLTYAADHADVVAYLQAHGAK